ncbi:MAG: PQQ-binding-like beta-propeller repeat protein [Bacteroidales bacterium]|nr:PQQ-binding-like beta-propeller repeat protein [Bacteroidales bacterium]
MTRVIFALLISIIFVSASAQDVAQWRGPNRDGIYTETGLLKKWPDGGPKLLWHFDELGDGHTSAAVTATGIYTSGMVNGSGFVYAFDLSGKLLWKKEYGKEWAENWNGTRSTPLVIGDKLYVLSSYWKVVCMNTSNGQTVWSADLQKDYGAKNNEWGIAENFLFDGNVLYCTPGGSGASMVALDRNSGKVVWKSKANGNKSAYCSPLMIKVKDKKIIVTMMENAVCGFDAATGQQLWKYEHINDTGVHPNIPAYINGYLYCTSGYGKGGEMLKLSDDGSSVTEVWKTKDVDSRTGGVVVMNGRIYGSGDRNKKMFCLDWQTGKMIFSSKEMAPATLIADEGLLYIYSESGKVFLVEPKADGFNILSSFAVPFGANPHWAHLVIKDKKLYVRHGTSLMVYDIAAK